MMSTNVLIFTFDIALFCVFDRLRCVLSCRRVTLTAARRLLAQLQPVDGQSVGSSAQVALLSFTLHIAFAVRNIGSLDLVTAVALRSELQACVHVPSGGEEKGKKGMGMVSKQRRESFK